MATDVIEEKAGAEIDRSHGLVGIAGPVDMVATGTDTKPLESLRPPRRPRRPDEGQRMPHPFASIPTVESRNQCQAA